MATPHARNLRHEGEASDICRVAARTALSPGCRLPPEYCLPDIISRDNITVSNIFVAQNV
jgi:hypothetical protein